MTSVAKRRHALTTRDLLGYDRTPLLPKTRPMFCHELKVTHPCALNKIAFKYRSRDLKQIPKNRELILSELLLVRGAGLQDNCRIRPISRHYRSYLQSATYQMWGYNESFHGVAQRSTISASEEAGFWILCSQRDSVDPQRRLWCDLVSETIQVATSRSSKRVQRFKCRSCGCTTVATECQPRARRWSPDEYRIQKSRGESAHLLRAGSLAKARQLRQEPETQRVRWRFDLILFSCLPCPAVGQNACGRALLKEGMTLGIPKARLNRI